MLGLLNIHKPAGITSRAVVDHVVKLVRPYKAGHAGTLDPLATGVLVVSVGSATRLIQYVQNGRKRYRAQFLFGQRSDTDDITGNVTHTVDAAAMFSSDDFYDNLQQLIPEFVGRIEQVPPQFSAVHVDGQRAYKLARQGKSVALKSRLVDVFSIDIIRFTTETETGFPELELDIECGSGTYIRSIGRDLGERLQCGAVMSKLVRTGVGPFSIEDAVSLEELTESSLVSHLQPASTAVTELPHYQCQLTDEPALKNGRSIICQHETQFTDQQMIAVMTPGGQLACLAKYDSSEKTLSPKQVFLTASVDSSSFTRYY